ncbi:MAG TPA: pyridoxamine 5'-phosphate oxidase family protein [Chitinophagales bacterium]|nr:pyridoxamine 5'-phosphate oxidase family protein [Chitinophagales bacterium]
MSSVKDAGSVEHLSSNDAIKKLRELVEDANICHFVTNLDELPLDARPMATQEVDEHGNIFFLSGADSHKNRHIEADARVQLFYTNSGGYEYLSVYGTATVTRDRKLIEEMWTPMAKAWFKKGKDDPNLTVITVKPEHAYYWDTKSNKLVSLVKIAASMISGASVNNGVEGQLDIR